MEPNRQVLCKPDWLDELTKYSSYREAILFRTRWFAANECIRFVTDADEIPVFSLTMGELAARAWTIASGLQQLGHRPGTPICILLGHTPDLVATIIATIFGRFVPSVLAVPTPKQQPKVFLRDLGDLLNIRPDTWVITSEELETVLKQVAVDNRVLRLNDVIERGRGHQFHDDNLSTSAPSPLFVQYSSGTTGLKKGVAVSDAALLSQIKSYAMALRVDADDRVISWLPLYHDMGLVACFLFPLVCGIPVTMIDPMTWVRNPRMLFDAIVHDRGTLCWLPNFAFHHLAKLCAGWHGDLSSMRAFVNCSEPCRSETFDEFLHTFEQAGVKRYKLKTCYAMAETVFAVCQSRIDGDPVELCVDTASLGQGVARVVKCGATGSRRLLSVGKPIDGVCYGIIDPQGGNTLEEGRIGEIQVSGAVLFDGYLNNEMATKHSLTKDGYCTGDLGFSLNGELYVTGRKKDLLIVHGVNYFAHDIESIAGQSRGVKAGRCVALGIWDDSSHSEEVTLLVELESSSFLEAFVGREIKSSVFQQLGLVVQRIIAVPSGWLIKTTSGKMSRRDNLAKYLSEPPIKKGRASSDRSDQVFSEG